MGFWKKVKDKASGVDLSSFGDFVESKTKSGLDWFENKGYEGLNNYYLEPKKKKK